MIQSARFIKQRVSGVRQDAMPPSSTSAVFTQLAACLHSLHDAIKGEQHREPFFVCCLFVCFTGSHSQPVSVSTIIPSAAVAIHKSQTFFCFPHNTHQLSFWTVNLQRPQCSVCHTATSEGSMILCSLAQKSHFYVIGTFSIRRGIVFMLYMLQLVPFCLSWFLWGRWIWSNKH